ncbi:MAG: Stk1 family PASTA domain-containing Ser/Thr kinase [Firmicutes bacterium]|nr:Stk1 family PASTA domain-containing Ser/Thr kinase [Bacillota bacterium]
MTQLIGKLLGNRYEILEVLGTGGMAVVYKGRDTILNRVVAIKVLKPEFNADEDFVKKFQKESQAAASLSHPNIVNVFDVGYSSDVHYIVMEIVNGNTLRDYLNKMQGFMREEAIINIGLQIASALSQAHHNEIVHRDIKSQNILINEQGSVKVADFGIARAATTATIVNTKEVIGSVHYASPEQARGGIVDARSDIYSLGILLYELATKKLPFEGDSPVTVALKQIKDDLPNPKLINGDISDGLASIIHKCAEKMPNDRYQDINDMIEDLKTLRIHRDFIVNDQQYVSHETTVLPKITEEELMAHQTKRRPVKEVNQQLNDKMPETTKKGSMTNKKLNMTLVILAGMVMAMLVFGILAVGKFKEIFDVKVIEVPGVVGMASEEAVRTLNEAGLKADVTEQRVSNDVEAGYIISQSHIEGEKVKEGFTIKLVVSSGGIESLIPNVKQQDIKEGTVLIENEGFEVGEITYEFNELPEGMIISQNPKAGIKMPAGTKIDLVLSQGSESDKALVPSLETKTMREAEITLTDIGLKLGTVTYEVSTTIEKGQIIRNARIGEEVEFGTAIDIIVSSGPTEESTEASTEATSEVVSSELKLTVTIETDKFEQDTETIRIEMVQGDQISVIYEKIHAKSEGPEIVVQSVVRGTGSAKIRVYYGTVMRLEQDIQF